MIFGAAAQEAAANMQNSRMQKTEKYLVMEAFLPWKKDKNPFTSAKFYHKWNRFSQSFQPGARVIDTLAVFLI
jgi:hypothetical protein